MPAGTPPVPRAAHFPVSPNAGSHRPAFCNPASVPPGHPGPAPVSACGYPHPSPAPTHRARAPDASDAPPPAPALSDMPRRVLPHPAAVRSAGPAPPQILRAVFVPLPSCSATGTPSLPHFSDARAPLCAVTAPHQALPHPSAVSQWSLQAAASGPDFPPAVSAPPAEISSAPRIFPADPLSRQASPPCLTAVRSVPAAVRSLPQAVLSLPALC